MVPKVLWLWDGRFCVASTVKVSGLAGCFLAAYLRYGIIDVNSKTCPVPSVFLAQTGVSNG